VTFIVTAIQRDTTQGFVNKTVAKQCRVSQGEIGRVIKLTGIIVAIETFENWPSLEEEIFRPSLPVLGALSHNLSF